MIWINASVRIEAHYIDPLIVFRNWYTFTIGLKLRIGNKLKTPGGTSHADNKKICC